jgi:uncharacterized surface anchored protein
MADILIGTKTTDENGIAAFENLPDGTYKYVQKAASAGYTIDSQEYTITVSGGTVTEIRTNAPAETGTLTAHKHVSGDPSTPVPGATFELLKGSKPMLAESAATDAEGNVSFPNLMSITGTPQDYTIREVTAPAGYLPNGNPYVVSVAANNTATQNVANVAQGANTLNVSLKDTNYQLLGLPGSDFDLYYVEP